MKIRLVGHTNVSTGEAAVLSIEFPLVIDALVTKNSDSTIVLEQIKSVAKWQLDRLDFGPLKKRIIEEIDELQRKAVVGD